MEARIKNIFGDKQITDINTFVLIEKKPEISIYYENKEIVLAVYGRIFCSTPHKIISIKLKEMSEVFSNEEKITHYIRTGQIDDNLAKQKEIISVCLFGNQIKKKVQELELQIKQGKTTIELKCSKDYIVAIENYARKQHDLKASRSGSIITLTHDPQQLERRRSTSRKSDNEFLI